MSSRRQFVQQFSYTLAAMPMLGMTVPPLRLPNRSSRPVAVLDPVDPATTTADIIVDKLIDWKVQLVFGLTGDGVIPIVEALRRRRDQIRYITVRHEEAAAFMASGYAKYTGRLGVCLATTGPGAVHLLNGLYDAKMEGAPVLAITGVVNHDLLGTQFTQEVDTVKMLQDVAVYNQQITGPIHALTVVDLACRSACGVPGVAHITAATDIQSMPYKDDRHSKKGGHLTGSFFFVPRIDTPPDEDLDKAAEFLNRSNKIAILAGRGALGASAELRQLADKLGAPVAKALLGKTVLPDDSPLTTGGTGNLGTLPSKQIMQECDTLLILGSNMPHLEYYPQDAIAIQVDRDPRRIALRYPVTLGLQGDVRATLAALLPRIKTRSNRDFLKLAQQRMAGWRNTLSTLETNSAPPVKPPFLVAQVSRLAKDDALLAIDTGAHTVFTARHWQARAGQQIAVCGNLASMAPALPYAIAAQLAYPERQCIAMVGDGSLTMLMGELATAVFYQLPVKVIVFKNNILAMDRFEQQDAGDPAYGITLQPIDFARIAEACGADGYSCANPADVEPTLRKAFASPRPAVIEVEVDPDMPPAPPDKV